MQQTLLVVESDDALREAITTHLRNDGYFVVALADGESALEVAQHNPLALVLLDLALAKPPGLDVYHALRLRLETATVPILLLLAHESQVLQGASPKAGVDDYMLKPLDWNELFARVRTLLRFRAWSLLGISGQNSAKAPPIVEHSHEDEQVLVVDDLCIDIPRRMVVRHDQPIDLSPPLLFDLLVYLVRNRGVVLSRERLLLGVWSYDRVNHSRTVDVHMRWLRQKIEDDPDNPQLILTVRGVGYRFKE
jgi:DNA-binding response OmpR family regulator